MTNKNMSKKINKIAYIIMLTCFIVNVLLAVFLWANVVFAAGECGEGKIRVQVPIPGLTQSCEVKTWRLNESGQAEEISVTQYYADSLPDFVKKFYTFSIGVIAIIAVLMIMIGGLQWIFAAGSATKISNAKSRIFAALAGLILALFSYVILNTLNPRLTNLELPGVTGIGGIEQPETQWCDDLYGKLHQGRYLLIFQKADGTEIPGFETKCGEVYNYGYKRTENEFVRISSCNGRAGCEEEGTYCVNTGIGAGYYCLNVKNFCESHSVKSKNNKDKEAQLVSSQCHEVTKMIRDAGILDKSCAKDIDPWYHFFWGADSCKYGSIMTCGPEAARVSCLTNEAAICWKELPDGQKTGDFNCTDDVWANNENEVTICCRESDGSYHLAKSISKQAASVSIVAKDLDCRQVHNCDDYSKFDLGEWLRKNDSLYCNVCK